MTIFEQMYEEQQRVDLVRGIGLFAYRLLICAALIKYLFGW